MPAPVQVVEIVVDVVETEDHLLDREVAVETVIAEALEAIAHLEVTLMVVVAEEESAQAPLLVAVMVNVQDQDQDSVISLEEVVTKRKNAGNQT